jgi:hypothetical protein
MKDEQEVMKTPREQQSAGIRRFCLRFILHPSAFILCYCLACSSCSSLPELPWAPVAKDAQAGFYETARLEYRIDAGKLGQPLDVVRVDGRRVAYEQIASSPLAEQSVGTLVIQYPHPAGRAGAAHVTFSLDSSRQAESDPGLNPFKSGKPALAIAPQHEEVHEVWAMDIPASESDRYFKLVSTENFYREEGSEDGPARLAVTVDGREVRKPWRQVPELNLLVQRVRREGQLVGYLRPHALAGAPSSAIASTLAYRQLVARSQSSPDVPPPAEPSHPSVASLPYAAR